MIGLVWDWHGLFAPWDWAGISTHLGIEEVAGIIVFGILRYGRYHAKHKGVMHRFAHSLRAQFILDLFLDILIAVTTIQIMHL